MGEDTTFKFNLKCVLQGAFVVGVWVAASSTNINANGWLPEPKMEWRSILFAALLFWITYAFNAVLDVNLGCDHGTFYDKFKL